MTLLVVVLVNGTERGGRKVIQYLRSGPSASVANGTAALVRFKLKKNETVKESQYVMVDHDDIRHAHYVSWYVHQNHS